MKRNNFHQLFPDTGRKIFLPVIHLTDSDTEIHEVGKAIVDGDADGVCLICHTGSVDRVLKAYHAVRDAYTLPIVLNFLGQKNPLDILQGRLKNCPPAGLWTDEGICEPSTGVFNTPELDTFRQKARQLFPDMFLARGIAFKHQQYEYPSGLEVAVKTAIPYMDLMVTSGPDTGHPPDPNKIREMSEAGSDQRHPLAIASGITAENVFRFKDYARCFMVSSGLCEESDVLSPKLLREFAACLRAGT